MLINRKAVKQYALHAVRIRSHPFTRVGAEFYPKCEAQLKEFIRRYVRCLPSKGRTIR